MSRRKADLCLVGIVCSPVVQIMTETSYQQAEDLQVIGEPVHLAGLEHREHGLADVESVAPVVIFDWSIVLLDTESPPADNLAEQGQTTQPPVID